MSALVKRSQPNGAWAYGEILGMDVPTRYSAQDHAVFNKIMALDSLVTPALLRMSRRTLWFCRAVAGLLLLTQLDNTNLSLRHRLELEAATGLALIILAFEGTVSRRLMERLYLAFGGVLMVANSLMTQVE